MQSSSFGQIDRRRLFSMIGAAAGATVMYNAMATLGFAAQSKYAGPIKLQGDPKGATVLILGAGVAGVTAALELRDAGYRVQILEYGERAGGRGVPGDRRPEGPQCHAAPRELSERCASSGGRKLRTHPF
jgi:monoamine oxidase